MKKITSFIKYSAKDYNEYIFNIKNSKTHLTMLLVFIVAEIIGLIIAFKNYSEVLMILTIVLGIAKLYMVSRLLVIMINMNKNQLWTLFWLVVVSLGSIYLNYTFGALAALFILIDIIKLFKDKTYSQMAKISNQGNIKTFKTVMNTDYSKDEEDEEDLVDWGEVIMPNRQKAAEQVLKMREEHDKEIESKIDTKEENLKKIDEIRESGFMDKYVINMMYSIIEDLEVQPEITFLNDKINLVYKNNKEVLLIRITVNKMIFILRKLVKKEDGSQAIRETKGERLGSDVRYISSLYSALFD